MPALAVAAHSSGFLDVTAYEHIHQARLAHTRPADKHCGFVALGNYLGKALHRRLIAVGNGEQFVIAHEPIDMRAHFFHFSGRGHQVGLGKHHQHFRSRFVGQDKLALQAACVDIFNGLGDDNQVEVGGQRLRKGPFGRVFAHKRRAPGQRLLDDALVMPVGKGNAHYIAHHRTLIAALHQGSGMLATKLTAIAQTNQGEASIELHHHSGFDGWSFHYSVPSRLDWYRANSAKPASTETMPRPKSFGSIPGLFSEPAASAETSST